MAQCYVAPRSTHLQSPARGGIVDLAGGGPLAVVASLLHLPILGAVLGQEPPSPSPPGSSHPGSRTARRRRSPVLVTAFACWRQTSKKQHAWSVQRNVELQFSSGLRPIPPACLGCGLEARCVHSSGSLGVLVPQKRPRGRGPQGTGSQGHRAQYSLPEATTAHPNAILPAVEAKRRR